MAPTRPCFPGAALDRGRANRSAGSRRPVSLQGCAVMQSWWAHRASSGEQEPWLDLQGQGDGDDVVDADVALMRSTPPTLLRGRHTVHRPRCFTDGIARPRPEAGTSHPRRPVCRPVRVAPSSSPSPSQTSFSPWAKDRSGPLARSSRYCLCSPDKFGGIDFERPSEHPDEVEADVTATSFQRRDVGAIDVGLVSKLLLAEAKLVSVVPDAISEQPLAFGDLDRRLRHEVI